MDEAQLKSLKINEKLDVQFVQEFINSGANLNATNKNGYSLLMIAVENNQPEIAQQLIEAGAKIAKTTFCNASMGSYSAQLNQMLIKSYGKQTGSWVHRVLKGAAKAHAGDLGDAYSNHLKDKKHKLNNQLTID